MHVHRVKERQIRNIIATEKSRSFAQFDPIIVLSFTQVSVLRRLYCPILENEWENGERTFFSFSRFQTPHGQCDRYNRNCLRRRPAIPRLLVT